MMHRTLGAFALVALAACGGAPADDTAATTMEDSTTMAMEAPAPAPAGDIVETAAAAGSFNTLAAALTAADLVETLKGAGPFTVLAPTDEAFAKIPEADLQALLADKEKLTQVLMYHVIAGNVMASQVTTMTEATTLEGRTVTISVQNGQVVLNGNANVTATDVAATNGVIHVIDTVLMPPM